MFAAAPVGSRPPLALVALLVLFAWSSGAPVEGKAPVVVRVTKFEVPDEAHDHFKNELKLWPAKMAKASKNTDTVVFVTGDKPGRYELRGKVVAEKKEIQIIAELIEKGKRKPAWTETYRLTEFPKKVQFVDQTREKILAGVKKVLAK